MLSTLYTGITYYRKKGSKAKGISAHKWLGAVQRSFCSICWVIEEIVYDGGRSMYLPAEWGPRIPETTLLGDSATTTQRAGLGCAQMGSPVD